MTTICHVLLIKYFCNENNNNNNNNNNILCKTFSFLRFRFPTSD